MINYQIVICILFSLKQSAMAIGEGIKMKAISGIVVAILIALISEASATSWGVKIEDDLFSQKKKVTLIGVIDRDSFVYADCRNGNLSLAFIMRTQWKGHLSSIPVALVYQVDKKASQHQSASFYEHNDRFTGVKVTDSYSVVAALDSFSKAKSSILIGFMAGAGKYTASEQVSVSGSTKAIRSYFSACEVDTQSVLSSG